MSKTFFLTIAACATFLCAGCSTDNSGLIVTAEELQATTATATISENPGRRDEHPEVTGAILGRVNFTGTQTEVEFHRIAGDRFCEEVHAEQPIRKKDVVINPNGTVANVVVWVASGGPDWLYEQDGESKPPQVITQQNCDFYPRVVALQTGQRLAVRNTDDTLHNVNAQPRNNPRLNYAMRPDGEPAVMKFDNPEVAIKLKSDIHPWMIAWAVVFDHGEFAVTGEDGTFELRDLPPGEYVVEAWHEEFGTVQAPVMVFADRPSNVAFNFTNKGSKSGSQVNPDGSMTTGTIMQLPGR